MAEIYLSSVDGSDSDDGSTWALAKATLAGAFAAASAGDTIYVDDSHAETQASGMTLTSPGTAASPVRVLCVDRTGNPEPPTALETTATVTTTGNSKVTFFTGFTYIYGLTFVCGSGSSSGAINMEFVSTAPWWWHLEACTLHLASTGAVRLQVGPNNIGADNNLLTLVNTPIQFSATGQKILLRSRFTWRDTGSAIAGTAPTTLFESGASGQPNARAAIIGVDLSALGNGDSIVTVGDDQADYVFRDCKLGASVSLTTGTPAGQGGTVVEVINCDSADTNYRYYKSTYQGEISHESTIVRTDGASDGTTPISRKMVSSANSKLYSPLELGPLALWNETTGSSVTVTVEIVTDNVTLTDKECWIEVDYLGTSGFPLSLRASDRAADDAAHLGSGANQASSSETWTTTGLTTPVKQALSVSFTPQEKGPIYVRVMLAKASTTVYVDPQPVVT